MEDDPIRATGPLSELPRSLVAIFNRWARQPSPTFRVPSGLLAKEVPWEDVIVAWQKGLLWAISIGVKDRVM